MSDFDLLSIWGRMRRAQGWYRYLLESRTSRPDVVAGAKEEARRLEEEWSKCIKEARSGLVTLF